jgi:predicted nucleic-acid-binding Zn-ribbon protein
MRCQKCGYIGLTNEYELDLTVAASPSGQYPRICPKCKEYNYHSKDVERSYVDDEALFLIQKLKQIVDSGDFEVSKIKEDINTLLEYKGKSFRYGLDITEVVEYAHKKIEERGE